MLQSLYSVSGFLSAHFNYVSSTLVLITACGKLLKHLFAIVAVIYFLFVCNTMGHHNYFHSTILLKKCTCHSEPECIVIDELSVMLHYAEAGMTLSTAISEVQYS